MVGNGGNYGVYNNPPLPDDREVLFVLGVVSSYEGVTKLSFSDPSNPIGVITEVESKPVEPVDTQSPNNEQKPPVEVVEEDLSNSGNSLTKLLEEAEFIEKIPIRKTKPLSGRSPTRRQRLPYSRDPPALVVGLSVAIGVLGFFLLVSIFVYFYLRHKVHRNDLSRRRSRRRSDRQSLTFHGGSTSTIELVCCNIAKW